MTSPSRFAILVFLATVAAVAWALLRAARAARLPIRRGESGGRAWLAVPVGVFVIALVVPGVLASAGVINRYAPMPAPPLLLTGLITVGTVALAFSPFGRRLAASVPLASLVGYQVF